MRSPLATVLVVDDAADLRMLVRTVLELSGDFDVVGEAGNGADAIDIAKRLQPQLVLLDVSMPGMDGLEALPHVRAAAPHTRVVMYSGFDPGGLAEQARELGAAGFLEKSVSIDQLPRDLAALVGGAPAPPAAQLPSTAAASSAAVLEQHLERFREVFDQAVIGMGAMTLAGRLVRVNRAFADIVGQDPNSLIGQEYVRLGTDLTNDHFDRALLAFAQGSDRVEFEHGIGARRVRAIFSPARDATRRPLYLFLQLLDVTALAEANRRLEQANSRVVASAVDQSEFVAVTVHELRSPLGVVTGAAEMLVEHGQRLSPEQRADLTTSMRKSAGRLNRLLADLLTSSRLQSRAMDVSLERVDVAELLHQVAATAARTWPDQPLTVDIDNSPDARLVIDADPDRIGQAVDNLVINALHHGAAPVQLSARGLATSVEVRVCDSGPGVSTELLPRLFQRFATGRSPGGTGLGLFIVRELARAHGGDAWYERADGAGVQSSCFVLSIPRSHA